RSKQAPHPPECYSTSMGAWCERNPARIPTRHCNRRGLRSHSPRRTVVEEPESATPFFYLANQWTLGPIERTQRPLRAFGWARRLGCSGPPCRWVDQLVSLFELDLALCPRDRECHPA